MPHAFSKCWETQRICGQNNRAAFPRAACLLPQHFSIVTLQKSFHNWPPSSRNPLHSQIITKLLSWKQENLGNTQLHYSVWNYCCLFADFQPQQTFRNVWEQSRKYGAWSESLPPKVQLVLFHLLNVKWEETPAGTSHR